MEVRGRLGLQSLCETELLVINEPYRRWPEEESIVRCDRKQGNDKS